MSADDLGTKSEKELLKILRQRNAENKTLRAQVEEAEKRDLEYAQNEEKFEGQLRFREEEVKQLNERIKTLNAELESLRSELLQRPQEEAGDTSPSRNRGLQDEIDSLQEAVDALTTEKHELETKLKAALTEDEATARQALKEIERFEAETLAAQKEAILAETFAQEKEDEAEDLRAKLTELQERFKAKALTHFPELRTLQSELSDLDVPDNHQIYGMLLTLYKAIETNKIDVNINQRVQLANMVNRVLSFLLEDNELKNKVALTASWTQADVEKVLGVFGYFEPFFAGSDSKKFVGSRVWSTLTNTKAKCIAAARTYINKSDKEIK